MRKLGAILAAVGLFAFLPAAVLGGTVGLVPDPDPDRHRELVRGAELALRAGAGSPRLAVGRPADHWNGLTAVIEELVAEGADVLVAPADRRAAHLVAQVATRRHLPAVATSAQGGLAATGSWWFVTCKWEDRESAHLATRLGRPPSEWEVAGWSAVRIAGAILETSSGSRASPGSTWRDRLPESCRPTELQTPAQHASSQGIRHDDHDR